MTTNAKTMFFVECDPPLESSCVVAVDLRDATEQVLAELRRSARFVRRYFTVWRYAARMGLELSRPKDFNRSSMVKGGAVYVFVTHVVLS